MQELYLTRRQQIETDKILYLESDTNYTLIYTSTDSQVLVAFTLGTLQTRLDEKTFIRVNKSYIVNLSYVSTYRHENNKTIIKLLNGLELVASRRRLRTFRHILTPLIAESTILA